MPAQLNDLDHQAFDLVFKRSNLPHEIASLVGSDGAANNCSADAASATEGDFRGDIDLSIK